MRYFDTSNANREYKVGGFSFRFDPADIHGGVWSGVLAIENEEAATALAAGLSKIPQIHEITEEEYLAVKKKDQPALASFRPLKAVLEKSPHATLAVVAATPSSSSSETDKPVQTLDEAIKLTEAVPVDELAEMEQGQVKRPKKRK